VSAAPREPYDRLLELLERQLKLAGEGRFEELAELGSAFEELRATLPQTPPPEAAGALTRAGLMQQRLDIELARGKEALLHALGELQRAHRAARGYAPPRRGPRISTSA
jgi:hypothetical protein